MLCIKHQSVETWPTCRGSPASVSTVTGPCATAGGIHPLQVPPVGECDRLLKTQTVKTAAFSLLRIQCTIRGGAGVINYWDSPFSTT